MKLDRVTHSLPHTACCWRLRKGRGSQDEQFLGGCLLNHHDTVTRAVTKGIKGKAGVSSLSGQFSPLLQSHFLERFKRKKREKRDLKSQKKTVCSSATLHFLLKDRGREKDFLPNTPQVHHLYHIVFPSPLPRYKRSPSSHQSWEQTRNGN